MLRAFVFALAALAALPARAEPPHPAQLALHLLDYIAVDYRAAVADGKVIDEFEYEEMREFSRQVIREIEALSGGTPEESLRLRAAALLGRVEAKADPLVVRDAANDLRGAVIEAWDVRTVPAHRPDLELGKRVFAANCASCHGVDGRGDGPSAIGLDPPPGDFHDTERMSQRSLYGLYSTVTLGVAGTSMASFDALTEDERWSVAAYVASLSATADPLQRADQLLAAVVEAHGSGHAEQAERMAIAAYLEGIEPVEAALAAQDPRLVREIEAAMLDLRGALGSGVSTAEIEQRATGLEVQLERARARLGGGLEPAAAFVASFLVLAREGLEAILVLAAVIAFIRKAGRSEALPWVHVGWITALAAGAATWAAATWLIDFSGADRELTEGITALAAAAMLLYVGYWLHDKAHAKAWSGFIGDQVGNALGRRTRWALAAVAFLAVYREVFEVVLFYQTLFVQAGPAGLRGLAGGAAAAAVALTAVGWLLLRYSVRLPIGPFFAVTSVLLAVMAVVFAGRGVAALQEAGVVSVTPIPFLSLPAVGLFPTTQTVAAQLTMTLAVATCFLFAARSARVKQQ